MSEMAAPPSVADERGERVRRRLTSTVRSADVPARTGAVPPPAWAGLLTLAVLAFVVLLWSSAQYGFFGDELYFRAAGDRLAFSYADQGPVIPAIAALMDAIAPGSMIALRLPSVLATAVAVVVAGLIARELGGGRVAQLLSAAAYVSSPFLLAQGVVLSTNALDTVLWTAIIWLVLLWVRTRSDRLLFLASILTAVDLGIKWLVPVLWLAIIVSVLLVGPRAMLRRPALWAGGALVVLSVVPSLVWQARNGWPQLAMTAIVGAEQEQVAGRWTFVPIVIASAGLLGAVLLVYGTWRLLRAPGLRPYRFLGLTTLVVVAAFIAMSGRAYYASGMLAVCMAAGAVEMTRPRLRSTARRVARWAALTPLFVLSLLMTAVALPLQPVDSIPPVRSQADIAFGISIYGKFGWPELAAITSEAYRSLPPDVARGAVVVTETYWSAGAIDQMGTGLPPVYSTGRGFRYFGAPPEPTTTALWVSTDPPSGFRQVRPLARVDSRLGMPGETRDVTVWLAQGPTESWAERWARTPLA